MLKVDGLSFAVFNDFGLLTFHFRLVIFLLLLMSNVLVYTLVELSRIRHTIWHFWLAIRIAQELAIFLLALLSVKILDKQVYTQILPCLVRTLCL